MGTLAPGPGIGKTYPQDQKERLDYSLSRTYIAIVCLDFVVKGTDVSSQADTFVSLMNPSGRRAWIAFGLWMRIFIAGLALAAGGVVLLVGGTSSLASGFGFLIGGGVLALLAWYRGQSVLERINRPGATVEASASRRYLSIPSVLAGAMHDAAGRLPETALK